MEDKFSSAYGFGEGLFYCPPRCYKLYLLHLIFHLEVSLKFVLVKKFLDKSLGIVPSQYLLNSMIHN